MNNHARVFVSWGGSGRGIVQIPTSYSTRVLEGGRGANTYLLIPLAQAARVSIRTFLAHISKPVCDW